jgi:hypothetical protein
LRLRTSLLCALFVGTLVAAASSQPAPLGEVELEWVAPAECPTGAQVLEDARGLVTGEHPASPAERMTVHAVVEAIADNRWRLSLSVGSSRRQVEASSCAELGRAAALFLALLVDPLRREAAEAPPSPPPRLVPSEPRAAAPSAAPPPRPAPEPEPARWALGIGAGLDYGTLRAPVVLGALGASVSVGSWEVNAYGWLGSKHTRRLRSGVGAELVPGVGILEGCYAHGFGSTFRLGPCLAGEFGVLRGRATGVDHPRSGYWPWIGLDATVAFTVLVGRHVELRGAAGGALPLYRPAFSVAGEQVTEPGLALRASALGLYRF